MKSKSVKRNYLYNMTYQILLIVIPLVVTPYISRVLLPSGVGQYSFSNSIITYFTIFAAFGFGLYGQREIAKNRDDIVKKTKVFWEVMLCRLTTVLLSVVINIILILLNVYSLYSNLLLIMNLNIVAIVFDISFFLQGDEEFGKLVLINLIIKIIGTVCIFLFVKEASHVWVYTLIHSLIILISNISVFPFLKGKLCKIKIKELRPFRHFKDSLKLFIPTFATSLYTVLDKSLIGIITHDDFQNGFYEQADKIVKMALTIVVALGAVMVSRNSYEIANGNIEEVKKNNYKAFHFVWLLGFPMMFGLMAVSDNFVPWFLGEDFNFSSVLIKLLSVLILIIGVSNVIGTQFLIPSKKDKKYSLAICIGAGVNLILNVPLIYFLGATGAAIATIFAELTISITMLIIVRKEISYFRIFKMAIKPLLAGLIMFSLCCTLNYFLEPSIINTIIIIIVGIASYGLSILVLKDELIISLFAQIKESIFKKRKHSENITLETDIEDNIVEDSDYKEGLEEDENIKPGK